jgi:rhamnulokinase
MAAQAAPFKAVLHPDAFLHPGGMPERIAAWCRGHGQAAPETPGEFARSIFESLALRYRQVLESLESVTGRRLQVIHIVGGGSRNQVLNQFVADATSRVVVAGPAEATAAGNILVQAIGAGALKDLAEARSVVRSSLPLSLYEPKPSAAWEDAYQRFLQLPAA